MIPTTHNSRPTTWQKVLVLLLLVVGCWSLVDVPEVRAQSFNLIVCDGVQEPCTFAHFIQLIKNVITALITISTFLATAAFAYAGFKLLASGGNENAKNEAKRIFTKVLIGYLWILGAWLIVYTITSVLLNTGFSALQP